MNTENSGKKGKAEKCVCADKYNEKGGLGGERERERESERARELCRRIRAEAQCRSRQSLPLAPPIARHQTRDSGIREEGGMDEDQIIRSELNALFSVYVFSGTTTTSAVILKESFVFLLVYLFSHVEGRIIVLSLYPSMYK